MANTPFKMKNPTLSAGRKGAPIQANYGGGDESPTKFIGGILRGVSRGIRGVQRKVRGTVGKVARGAGLGGAARAIGLGKRKRGPATKAGQAKMKHAINTAMFGVGGRGKFGKGKKIYSDPTRKGPSKGTKGGPFAAANRALLSRMGSTPGGPKRGGPRGRWDTRAGRPPVGFSDTPGKKSTYVKGGFGVGAAAASMFGSSRPKRPVRGKGRTGVLGVFGRGGKVVPHLVARSGKNAGPKRGSQTSRASKRRALFGGGLFGRR